MTREGGLNKVYAVPVVEVVSTESGGGNCGVIIYENRSKLFRMF